MASPKTCFVTIGATASFATLVQSVLTSPFLSALKQHGYTDLLVQYGAEGKEMFERAEKLGNAAASGVNVKGFDLDPAGLGKHMKVAKGARGAQEGVVISHAGT